MTLRMGLALGFAAVSGGVAAPSAMAVEKVDATEIELPAPPEGKGQVIFFRAGRYVGSAVNCTVYENGQKLSSLGGGRYFILVAEPGRHEFSVKSESKDTLALEVEPDETQFVGCKIKMGFMVGRPDIRPSTEAEFREAKLALTDTDDMEAEAVLRPEQIAAALSAPVSAPVAEESMDSSENEAEEMVLEEAPDATQPDEAEEAIEAAAE